MASKAPPPAPSMPPQGVPSGGNGKFILLAVLLVVAIAAVIGWKTCQKAPDPVVITLDGGVAPPPPTKNPDDDIPPPPVVEDAATADAGPAKPQATAFLGTQCDAKKCGGASTSEVETALAFRAKQSHRCYDNALGQDPTLRGKMSINVRIGANGTACSAGVGSNELASNPGVAQCVVNNFRNGAFPAPRGGCIDVSIPINFVPRQ